MALRVSSLAPPASPASISAGSPGARWIRRKLRVMAPSTRSIAPSARRPMNRARLTVSGLLRLLPVHVEEGTHRPPDVGRDTVELLVPDGREAELEEPDERQLRRQDLLDLVVCGLAPLDVHLALGPGEELVHPGAAFAHGVGPHHLLDVAGDVR